MRAYRRLWNLSGNGQRARVARDRDGLDLVFASQPLKLVENLTPLITGCPASRAAEVVSGHRELAIGLGGFRFCDQCLDLGGLGRFPSAFDFGYAQIAGGCRTVQRAPRRRMRLD